MESILKEINSVSGVSGSFVCNEMGKVVTSAMPNVFGAEMLGTVGRTAAQTLSGLQLSRRRKVSEMDLVHAGGRVIVKAMARGYLIILCIRNVNVPLLNLTANMALKRLAAEMSKPKENAPATAPRAAQPASQPAPAPAAPAAVSAPEAKNGSLSATVPALASLAEALIGGAERQGVNRSTLLTILDSRYRAIVSKYHLNERSFVSGEFDLSHWSEAEISPAEAIEALGELIDEIYHIGLRLLGPNRAKSLYQQAYQSVAQKDGAALQQPAVQAMLPQRG